MNTEEFERLVELKKKWNMEQVSSFYKVYRNFKESLDIWYEEAMNDDHDGEAINVFVLKSDLETIKELFDRFYDNYVRLGG